MQIKSIVAVAAIAFLTSMGAVSAAEMSILEGITAEPLTLTDTQMDTVTAGNLLLPNDNVIFGDPNDFDNPAPGDFHPNFGRSLTAFDATLDYNGPKVPFPGSGSNEGPWSATTVSPVISICGSGFAACP